VGGAKNVSRPVARLRRARGFSAWGRSIAAGVGSGGLRKVLNERICYLAIVAQGGFEGWAYRTEEEV
jgi:hypothetical protein